MVPGTVLNNSSPIIHELTSPILPSAICVLYWPFTPLLTLSIPLTFTVPGHNLDQWKEQLVIARQAFSNTSTNTHATKALPIGAGFLGWTLDAQIASQTQQFQDQSLPKKFTNSFLEAALDSRVRAIWLSFGSDLKKWIDLVREHDRDVGNVEKEKRTLIFVQVNSVEEAVLAVKEWEVDAVSLQGMSLLSLIHRCHNTFQRSRLYTACAQELKQAATAHPRPRRSAPSSHLPFPPSPLLPSLSSRRAA